MYAGLVGLVVVGVVLGLVGLLIALIIQSDERSSWFWGFAWIGIFLGFFGGCVEAIVQGSYIPETRVVVETHQLVSFQDAVNIEGSFAGGILVMEGHIGTEVKLYYYESTPDGFQLHVMDETDPDVYIKQDSPSGGTLEVVQIRHNVPGRDIGWVLVSSVVQTKHIFHVPAGTIQACYSASAGQKSAPVCPNS